MAVRLGFGKRKTVLRDLVSMWRGRPVPVGSNTAGDGAVNDDGDEAHN